MINKQFPILLILATLLVGCVCNPTNNHLHTVTLHPQETNMWCWAASGQMIMDFLGHNLNQCTQANNRFGRTDCCNTPVPQACIVGGWPEFNKYNFSFSKTSNAALSWTQVQSQTFCADKPFAFTWHWICGSPPCGGHMMVVVGYQTQSGQNFVEVNDPWPPNVGTTGNASILTYNAYVSGPGYSHWDDYYDVTFTGGD
jgi:hypothetical protein